MPTKKSNPDVLAPMRSQVQQLIAQSYPNAEQFCWAKDLSKATVSNFLTGKKDFQISTLVKIANALGRKLTIHLD